MEQRPQKYNGVGTSELMRDLALGNWDAGRELFDKHHHTKPDKPTTNRADNFFNRFSGNVVAVLQLEESVKNQARQQDPLRVQLARNELEPLTDYESAMDQKSVDVQASPDQLADVEIVAKQVDEMPEEPKSIYFEPSRVTDSRLQPFVIPPVLAGLNLDEPVPVSRFPSLEQLKDVSADSAFNDFAENQRQRTREKLTGVLRS